MIKIEKIIEGALAECPTVNQRNRQFLSENRIARWILAEINLNNDLRLPGKSAFETAALVFQKIKKDNPHFHECEDNRLHMNL